MKKSNKKNKINNVCLAVVKNKDNEVLIIKRIIEEDASGGRKLTWVFPGGIADDHEEKSEVAELEALEETGYKVKAIRKISERDYSMPNVHLAYFECELVSEDRTELLDVEEVEQVRWVPVEYLMDFFTTDVDPVVAKFLGLKNYLPK